MKNKIFLLSHQDDEIAILNHIKKSVQSKDKIYVFYLTNGRIKKSENEKIIRVREKETLKALKTLGVNKNSIIFLGKKLKVNSYELHNKLDVTFKELSKFFFKFKDNTVIYSHSWEGGNTDHDSCYVISLKLMKKFSIIKSAYQFSMYNSYKMPFNLYRAFSPIKKNGSLIKFNIDLIDKLKFIMILFYYRSQLKIWFGLYPILIYKIIFNNYGDLQIIQKKFLLKKPHEKDLWYEKRNFITFNRIRLVFLKFLK